MNAILLAMTLISADYRPCDTYFRRNTAVTGYNYWGYNFVFPPMYSQWNAAVAELRARGPSRSRDLVLPTSTANGLRDLDLRQAELYAALIAAPRIEKAELRRQWLVARQELERARILAAKELSRGPGRTE